MVASSVARSVASSVACKPSGGAGGGGSSGAPVFTVQPANQTVASGASVTLTPTVTGDPAPTLQWQEYE